MIEIVRHSFACVKVKGERAQHVHDQRANFSDAAYDVENCAKAITDVYARLTKNLRAHQANLRETGNGAAEDS
jgi:hypothetical protein